MIYASFGRRAAAYLMDGLFLIIPFYFLNTAGIDEKTAKGIMFLFWFITWPIMISSPWQTTPGKFVLSMKVLRSDGSSVSLGRAFGRTFVSIISALLFYIGYLIAIFSTKKQTLHDLIADTVVVID